LSKPDKNGPASIDFDAETSVGFGRRRAVVIFRDPFLWAFIGMFGLLAGAAMVSGTKLGRCPLLGFAVVMVCDLARIVLVLPFCPQPRFEVGIWHWIAGGAILIVALAFAVPALSTKWWAAPDGRMVLKTTGIYGIVRNPIYLADVLFSLGFAIMFRSIVGVALTPVWWAGFLLVVLIEEESLGRTLGQSYLDYKQRVKGRIIPGLPI
jgi:protein-S-isoprenylcysteine O-methyltransferase Ste14